MSNDKSPQTVLTGPVASHDAAAETLGQLCEGLSAGISFTVLQQDMEDFGRLSVDDNPIHSDVVFARARGFEGPIVYGGLMVAAISRLLGTRLPGHGCVWHSLKIDFRAPLYVDETASLTGVVTYHNADLRLVRVALRLSCGDRVIAKGEAQASIRHAAP
jgi:3-hydroxybutyryl-CoA dehydratase